jgi:UDP-GlcNAc3NAcA epimerase
MSDVFFNELHLANPHYELGINQLSHNQMIGAMITALDEVIEKETPDLIVVYGDTNSTLAGAIASKKRNVRLAHIEAGIRTGDEQMPEEANRYIADRLADVNFCCTYLGVENLKAEGLFRTDKSSGVHLCGDLMLDAVKIFGPQSLKREISKLPLQGTPPILATIHRQENNEDPIKLGNIVKALNKLNQDTPVIFPLHPKTKAVMEKNKIRMEMCTCEPLGYFDMLHVLQKSSLVITDSGGLSREAFFLNKPTLVLMQYPFWPELFIHGNCLPCSSDPDEILRQHLALSNSSRPFNIDIFGNGHAAENISTVLLSGTYQN